jgi:hypothetical protein
MVKCNAETAGGKVLKEGKMANQDIACIRTEPITQSIPCMHIRQPNFRCTIEFIDGSTIMRCGVTAQHALANAIACYKTSIRQNS